MRFALLHRHDPAETATTGPEVAGHPVALRAQARRCGAASRTFGATVALARLGIGAEVRPR